MFESCRAHHLTSKVLVVCGQIADLRFCVQNLSVPEIVPTQRHASRLDRGPRVVFLRVNIPFCDRHLAVPGEISERSGSMNGAQRVRQVWRNV
jgi:hypothetical protein